MPKLVPLDIAGGIPATSDTGEWIEVCISVPTRPAFSDDDILVWLPVKCLLRCRSVCKAWRAMVLDPLFVHAHLQRSASKWEQDPSLIITPITFGRLLRGPGNTDFGREFKYLCYFAHCDGLVLAPTDANLYLFNPATRDSITLPNSHRNDLQYPMRACHCAGLGLDPRTGKYKVVQAFYRVFAAGLRKMGMETFTVNNGDACRARPRRVYSIMDDPPYPIVRWQAGQTVKGFMFWRIDRDVGGYYYRQPAAPFGLLCISLADEKFGVTRLPDSLDPALDDDSFSFQAAPWLHGREQELWLMACTGNESVTIWIMPVDDDGGQGHWERRYSIPVMSLTYPMALVGSRMLLRNRGSLSRYDLATSEHTFLCELDLMRYQGRRRHWKNVWNFFVLPYTESLVQITSA
ncbi:hypothetical protein BS78_10G223700 [Paspalum vaginatum]|nr:hypothetical protein BS78_10G223700 [Paspalum vaginatum]